MRSQNPHRDLMQVIAERRFHWILPQLLESQGVLCDLFKVKPSKERDIYRHYAGQKIEDEAVAKILVVGLPVAEFRTTGGGAYGLGYFTDTEAAYTDYCSLSEGDVLRPHETDAQFIVTNIVAAGLDGRMRRFALSSIQSGVRPDSHSYPKKLVIR